MPTLTPAPPAPHRSVKTASGPDPSPPDAASVRRVLDDILVSPPFCHTQQCQNLLRYIVKHSLAHEEHLLRERIIGAEVFGRPPDYETGEDPIVRIRVSEVRKRLAQFYQLTSGSTQPPNVQIEIPSGTYCASFRWLDVPKPAPELSPQAAVLDPSATLPTESGGSVVALPPPAQAPSAPSHRRLSFFWIALACVLVGTAAVVFSIHDLTGSPQERAFRTFWQPFTAGSKPVIISIGSNAVYRLSDELTDQYAASHGLETQGMEFFVPFPPDKIISGKDIAPAPNSFVALGDVASVSDIVATITRQGQAFQERFPNDVSFAELRNSPTVLVGGFNNPMTIELTRHLPFVLEARNEIDDTSSPNRRWILHASQDSHYTEDYAIITRLQPKNGDAPMLSVAGMGQYGTLAAANFICNPASIAQLVHTLPHGWQHESLQLVLHVDVVDFKPVSSRVVAVRLW